jgi:hypothetical protein
MRELQFASRPSREQAISEASYVGFNPAISRGEKSETIHEEGGNRRVMKAGTDVLRFGCIVVCRSIENRWNG